MRLGVLPGEERPTGEAVRWGLSLLAVVGLHVGGIAWVLEHATIQPMTPPPSDTVMMELPAPEPTPEPPAVPEPVAAPEPPPPAPPPPPEPPPPEPPPPEPPPPEPPPPEPPPPPPPEPPVVEPPPPVPPEVVLPEPPPPPPPPPPPRPEPPKPKPIVRPPPPRPRPPRIEEAAPPPPQTYSAPVAPVMQPPAPAATPSPPSNAVVNWRGQISARLARAKRYPEQARARGETGTVMAVFTVDRAGRVLSASVSRTSGSIMLDEEAIAAIKRADLPPMPPEMTEATMTFPVPFRFDLSTR